MENVAKDRQESQPPSSKKAALALADANVYPPYYEKIGGTPVPYVKEGDIDYPFEDTTGAGDENKIRGNWSSKIDFILSCLGYAVGLGNVWRFPYFCYRNGGGAFLIPYFLMLVFVGLPIFFMELSIGQFPSLGCIAVWKVCPLFKGVGIAMFIVSCFVAVYYNMVVAWCVHYVIASFRLQVPWASCGNPWNTPLCSDLTVESWRESVETCVKENGTMLKNGSCIDQSLLHTVGDNATVELSKALTNVFRPDRLNSSTMPSDEYFHRQVLKLSEGIEDVGTIDWQLALYLLVVWLLVFFCMFKGIKSSGKVMYVMTVAPYLILLILLVRGLTLPGSIDGILYLFRPEWRKLLEPRVWGEAAIQVFFSLSTCWGGLVTLASYNRFHNNCYRDMWIVGFGDAFTSLFASCVCFATLGYMSFQLHVPIDKVATKGAGLVFVVYAEAIAQLPIAPVWSILLFSMLIMLGSNTQIGVVETIVTAICDEFPEKLRKNHRHILALCCVIFYILGVPLCTDAGMYILQLIDYFSASWGLLIIGFFECMSLAWVYGVDNLLDNIKWMTGFYPRPYMYWKLIWKGFEPVVLTAILIFSWYDYRPLKYGDVEFPKWAYYVGWAISFASVIAIPITAIVKLIMAQGTCVQRFRDLIIPEDDWGPALAVHRAEQFPLQIPEARKPFKDDRSSNGLGGILEDEENENVPLNQDEGLPHFDRETAI